MTPFDPKHPDFGTLYDELPLWSAPFGQALLERVPLVADSTILDVGCGTGFLSIELAQRCRGSRVIAVDPWPAATRRLAAKATALQLEIDIREEGAGILALPDGSIDLAVSNLGVNNFDDPAAVLTNLHRMLRPGGALWLSTNLMGNMAEFYAVFRQTLVELDQSHRLPVLDAHEAHRGTLSSIAAMLSEAGFSVSPPHTDHFLMRFSDGQALFRHHFIRLGFLDGWRGIPEPDAIGPTLAVLQANLDRIAGEGGLTLTVPFAVFQAVRD